MKKKINAEVFTVHFFAFYPVDHSRTGKNIAGTGRKDYGKTYWFTYKGYATVSLYENGTNKIITGATTNNNEQSYRHRLIF